jgi:hypothetical protein
VRRFAISGASLCAAVYLTGSDAGVTRVSDQAGLEAALHRAVPVIQLPSTLTVTHEILIPAGERPIEIRGAPTGSVIRFGADFRGTAVFRARSRSHLLFAGFTIEGVRLAHLPPKYLPPWNVAFANFYNRNGIVVEGGQDITLARLHLTNVADFPVIVSHARHVRIDGLTVEDSGSRDERGRNNTSGGILLEEGTEDFDVRNCVLRRILGNAIWTHSNGGSPRNTGGRIADNRIFTVARDAVQIGHATQVVVEGNEGQDIGYPADAVDIEHEGTPVAVDTSGNVDHAIYRNNRFRNVNGECINLDGFHEGEVRNNQCDSTRPFENYPFAHYGIVMGNTDPAVRVSGVTIADNSITGTGYGGLYLIGTGNVVTGNRLLMLNRVHCTGDGRMARCNYALDQPDMLRSGIYLAAGAKHPAPAADNLIRGNEIRGFGAGRWCITAAPGVELKRNRIGPNSCAAE